MDKSTSIIAVITTKGESLKGGGVPIFIVKNKASLQEISSTLEKTLDASAHEVDAETMIIVAH